MIRMCTLVHSAWHGSSTIAIHLHQILCSSPRTMTKRRIHDKAASSILWVVRMIPCCFLREASGFEVHEINDAVVCQTVCWS